MFFWQPLVVLVLSYILGSIPFGLIVVKIAIGKDVRSIESGRTGGTNVMRAAGVLSGVITAGLDVLKALQPPGLFNGLLQVYSGCRLPRH